MMLIMWLIRNVFHSQTMFDVVVQLLRDHLPTNQDYVIRNLDSMVRARQRVKFASIAILLITSTGVFLPLEVAFNQIWGFTKNRSYLGNQIISLLLAFGCGLLAMASIGLAAGNQWVVQVVMFGHKNVVSDLIPRVTLKILATLASIGIFFLLYWLLTQRQSQCHQRSARCRGHGPYLGREPLSLYEVTSSVQFSRGLRAIFHFRNTYVLGLPLRADGPGRRPA